MDSPMDFDFNYNDSNQEEVPRAIVDLIIDSQLNRPSSPMPYYEDLQAAILDFKSVDSSFPQASQDSYDSGISASNSPQQFETMPFQQLDSPDSILSVASTSSTYLPSPPPSQNAPQRRSQRGSASRKISTNSEPEKRRRGRPQKADNEGDEVTQRKRLYARKYRRNHQQRDAQAMKCLEELVKKMKKQGLDPTDFVPSHRNFIEEILKSSKH